MNTLGFEHVTGNCDSWARAFHPDPARRRESLVPRYAVLRSSTHAWIRITHVPYRGGAQAVSDLIHAAGIKAE